MVFQTKPYVDYQLRMSEAAKLKGEPLALPGRPWSRFDDRSGPVKFSQKTWEI